MLLRHRGMHVPNLETQIDSWVSFAFTEFMNAEVKDFMTKARPMLAALMNNGIRHSGFQTAVSACACLPAGPRTPCTF